MHSVFISYRRADAAPYAGRLYDRLIQALGHEHVFMDIDSISYGEDFVEVISRTLAECEIVVVLIGPMWSDITDASGARRLDSPSDTVRLEISTAFELGRKVIPVLVGGAVMPDAQLLPTSMAALSRRNAIEISDRRFNKDAQELIETLNGLLSRIVKTDPTSREVTPKQSNAQASPRRHRQAALPRPKTDTELPASAGTRSPRARLIAIAAALALLVLITWIALSGKKSPTPSAPAQAGSAPAPPSLAVERPSVAPPPATPILSPAIPQASSLAETAPSAPLTASAPKLTVQDLIRQIKQSTSAVEKAALKSQARSLLAQQLDFGTVQLDDKGTHTTLTFKSYDPATNILLLSEHIQLGRNQIRYAGDWCTNKEKCTYSGDLKIDLGRLDRLQKYTDGSFELGCWFSHQSSNTKCITPIPIRSTCPITRCSESEKHANSIFEPPGNGIGRLASFKRAAGTIIYDIDGRPAK